MDETEASPRRAKRQKSDKVGKASAFEKLRSLQGAKNKYEVKELDNVYDEVDEKVYTKTVLDRQTDDWIVDDGGSGYVEDGREIFDDDLDDESISKAQRNNAAGPRKRKKKEDAKSKGNIKNMFMSMSSKSSNSKVASDQNDDNLLGDLLSELQNEQNAPKKKESAVRNRFSIVSKTEQMNKREMENEKKEEMAKIDKTEMEVDFNESIFEKSKQKIINTKEKSSEGKISSTSQTIEDKNYSQESMDEIESVKSDAESGKVVEKSADSQSQEIEEDISQFVGDLSNVDFENPTMDEFKKSQFSPTCKTIIEEIPEPEKESAENFQDQELFSQWDTDFANQSEIRSEISLDPAEIQLPLTKNSKGETIFRFYWWDAFEDPYKQPGTVYLFGKIYIKEAKTHVSCCLTVKNIPRRVYLLPREYVQENNTSEPQLNTLENVYKEFNEYATRKGIKEFRSSRVTKHYAFEQKDTPRSCEYLEVRYSTSYPQMESDYSGKCIERVFGTTVNSLEMLLIERNIKGPCWLDIKSPVSAANSTSWCKLQVNCMKMENISVYSELQSIPIPPMSVATMNLRVSFNSKSQQNEIVMAAILLQSKYQVDKAPPKPAFEQHYCIITHPRDALWPLHWKDKLGKITHTKILSCENESGLLEELLNVILQNDPDLIVGCDCGFQYDLLVRRLINLRVSNWSRIGKLRRSTAPFMKGKVNLSQVFCGRPVCDIQNSAKELNLKLRNYDLQSLCMSVLKKKENECKNIIPGEVPKFYSSAEKIENLLRSTMVEASYIISIMFDLNVIPLALQITNIAGNILSRTLSAGRAERNEYLLLHAFFQKGYITPDKKISKKGVEATDNSRKKKAAYAGGLVLDPKKGFYDKLILLMDFNSLYPSIIQEYNLCFTTVTGAAYADSKDLKIPDSDVEPGIVPTEIRKLVQSRWEVKKLLKTPNLSPEMKLQYHIRQMALKLTANSMYGCLGATHCRFYAKGLAALVTAKGREILQDTKYLVERLNYEVIYGDTDSIMINTGILDYDQVFSIGKKIKQEVNKLYKRVELDIDGVFRYLLLLQKKKYAALTMSKSPTGEIQYTAEHKGLDIVRRDWCPLACDIGGKILSELLSDQSVDTKMEKIYEILENVAKDVKENKVPLQSLVITKQLSKNPHEYPDHQKQAHVTVALRLNKSGGRLWKVGDTVPYIICEDEAEKSATERAYHIDEYKKSTTLKIDVNYYLLSQLFPVIHRICEPIEGIDDVMLAKYLGLEGIYKPKKIISEEDEHQVPMIIDEDRFRYCLPFKFKCRNPNCGTEIKIDNVITEFPIGKKLSLTKCSNPECSRAPYTYFKVLQNEVHKQIREAVTEYYKGWMECENPSCSVKENYMPLNFNNSHPTCEECTEVSRLHNMYSEATLYNQISLYLHIFDLEQPVCKAYTVGCPRDVQFAYDALKDTVENELKRNLYSVVDLGKIFSRQENEDVVEDVTVNPDLEEYQEPEEEFINLPEIKEGD